MRKMMILNDVSNVYNFSKHANIGTKHQVNLRLMKWHYSFRFLVIIQIVGLIQIWFDVGDRWKIIGEIYYIHWHQISHMKTTTNMCMVYSKKFGNNKKKWHTLPASSNQTVKWVGDIWRCNKMVMIRASSHLKFGIMWTLSITGISVQSINYVNKESTWHVKFRELLV